MEVSKEDFLKRFADPMVERMKGNMDPAMADKCEVEIKVKGKTGRILDFKSIMVEISFPD